MSDIFVYSLASWLVLGLIAALFIFVDQIKHDEKNHVWPVIGLLLNLLGVLLFYIFVARKRRKAPEYPAKPQYESPSYKYEKKEEAPAPAPEKKKVQQLEGAPRCENCGAAISAHDLRCPNCGKQLK
jgi:hypothetical protein